MSSINLNKIIDSLASSIPPEIKQLELPETTKERLIGNSLEEMATKANQIFSNLSSETFNSPQFQQFVVDGFLEIITSIQEEAEHLPTNITVECGVNEAIFSHALDKKPILATDSLATCVGIAGYESEHRFGFMIHIATVKDLEASEKMLTEKIAQIAKGSNNPIQLHLRGGIFGLSEPLVEAIEIWARLASEKGPQMVIKSKDVLNKELLDASGAANAVSISLDTRDGTIGRYNASTNPYAKQKIQLENADQAKDLFMKLFMEAPKTSEIKVVYFPSQQ